jgi:hypothetical protein
MRRFIILSLLLALILLPSCSPANRFDGGRPITPEDLESISAEVFGTADGSVESQPLNPNSTVYRLRDGTVYHTDRNCVHLSGKRNVMESTLRTAEQNGLSLCKDCGGQ